MASPTDAELLRSWENVDDNLLKSLLETRSDIKRLPIDQQEACQRIRQRVWDLRHG